MYLWDVRFSADERVMNARGAHKLAFLTVCIEDAFAMNKDYYRSCRMPDWKIAIAHRLWTLPTIRATGLAKYRIPSNPNLLQIAFKSTTLTLAQRCALVDYVRCGKVDL